jgi:hypothetical protein
MSRTKVLKGIVVLGLLLAGALPAGARTYQVDWAMVRTAVFGGKIAAVGSAGTASVVILQRDGVSLDGPFRIFPAANTQPWLGAPQSALLPATSYVGCIVITVGRQADFGCNVLRPVTIEADPLLNEASVTFAVKSSPYGNNLRANLVLRGTGVPAVTQDLEDVGIAPAPPEQPTTVDLGGGVFLARSMDVIAGTVFSDSLGGGPIIQTGVAIMSTGVMSGSEIDATKMMCVPRLAEPPVNNKCPI